MVVIAVGEHSQKGKISALLDTPNEDTPLTQKLERLAESICLQIERAPLHSL